MILRRLTYLDGVMPPLKSLFRLALPVAVAMLATPIIAAPALAQPDVPAHTWVSPSMPYLVNIAQDLTAAKPLKITIENQTALTAKNVVVRIDTTRLPATFRAELPGSGEGCTVAGAVATCTLAELAGNSTHVYSVGLRPGDLENGEYLGTITVVSSADNAPGEQSAETLVQLMGPGVDMVIGDIDDMRLAPGASATVPVVVGNSGTVAADAVALVLSTTHYLELPSPYSNCEYNPDYLELVCVFDQRVEPGDTFGLDATTPLKVKVADRAPGPYTYGAYASVVPLTEDAAAKSARRGTGEELRLVPRRSARALVPADDLNNDDNYTEFAVIVPKHAADSAAVGASVTGAIGETRTVKLGVRNDGPADVLTPGEGWASSAAVSLPAGLKALAVDEQCVPVDGGEADWEQSGEPNGLNYHCWPSENVRAGDMYTFVFKVEIVGEPGTAGVITVDGGVQDDNADNDTAPITLMPGSGGTGGGLPITGAKIGLVAGGGLLLIIGGGAVFWLTRRRRIVTVIED